MDNFHQNYKDKDNFLKSGYNFRDWGYLDPPKGPPLWYTGEEHIRNDP